MKSLDRENSINSMICRVSGLMLKFLPLLATTSSVECVAMDDVIYFGTRYIRVSKSAATVIASSLLNCRSVSPQISSCVTMGEPSSPP